MTEKEALIWCKNHKAKIKPVSFDDGTIWLAQMQLNGETIATVFGDYPGAVTKLRCKLQEKTDLHETRYCYEYGNINNC